jgi:signal transduction histidine kinase
MKTAIRPGLLRIFRYFTAVAMGYYAVVAVAGALQSGQAISSSQSQIYLNLLANAALFVYLSWGWLQRKLKAWYLPIALLVATVVPIFSNLFYLAEPAVKDLPLIIVRSWLLFPILIIPLVLIAWQYNFLTALIFILTTTIVDLIVLYPVVDNVNMNTLVILGVPLIRAFAFGVVSHIVSHLTATQDAQRKTLLRANYRLSQHANTLEQLAVSRERNRLARELHDTLAHTLSGQAVNLEAVKLMLYPEQTEALGMLDRTLDATRAGLRETRRALKDLRSLPVDDLGLGLAVRNLAFDAASRAGFELKLEIADLLPELLPDAEQCTFRIAQESLENIVQHAGAHLVELRLVVEQGHLELSIRDDGIGADLESLDSRDKFGVQGMLERAAEVHGTLAVNSQPGLGTTVHFSLEVPDD